MKNITVFDLELKQEEAHKRIDKLENGDGSHEEMANAFETAFLTLDAALEDAIRLIKSLQNEERK